MFDISPAEKVGVFTVKAKVLGVDMEKVQVHIQVKNFTSQILTAQFPSSLFGSIHTVF